MDTKRFTKNDSEFVCVNCGAVVSPLGYSSRNHCPVCLWSRHLDDFPGDRASNCGGEMFPLFVETDPRRGYIIVHKCKRCGAVRRNRAAHMAPVQPDDIKLLIKLTAAGK